VKFDIPANTTWIKVNVNQSGFYRVTYSDDIWQSIISALQHNHSVFSPADRASLIDDAFTLCRLVSLQQKYNYHHEPSVRAVRLTVLQEQNNILLV
jgi:aminopeptidase N